MTVCVSVANDVANRAELLLYYMIIVYSEHSYGYHYFGGDYLNHPKIIRPFKNPPANKILCLSQNFRGRKSLKNQTHDALKMMR